MVTRLSTSGLVEVVKSFDRVGAGELMICEVKLFDANEFVDIIESIDELAVQESSDGKISVVVEEKYAELAVRALHAAFLEDGDVEPTEE